MPASTLSGFCIGANHQLINAPTRGDLGDWLLYGFAIYPSTLSAAQITDVRLAIAQARGRSFAPQIASALTMDGSSTTG